jgi:hypothetical protein
MKSLLATLITLATLLLAAPAAVACADENFCNNRPSASADPAAKPQTRALKKKPKKECHGSLACERSATADGDAKPQTRALKKKPKTEACEENFCK